MIEKHHVVLSFNLLIMFTATNSILLNNPLIVYIPYILTIFNLIYLFIEKHVLSCTLPLNQSVTQISPCQVTSPLLSTQHIDYSPPLPPPPTAHPHHTHHCCKPTTTHRYNQPPSKQPCTTKTQAQPATTTHKYNPPPPPIDTTHHHQ